MDQLDLRQIVSADRDGGQGNLPYHHVHTPAPDPRERVPELPEGLVKVILRCLRKDPEERYPSAREILADLREVAV